MLIVSKLVKTVVYTRNDQSLGGKVHTHGDTPTGLAANLENCRISSLIKCNIRQFSKLAHMNNTKDQTIIRLYYM